MARKKAIRYDIPLGEALDILDIDKKVKAPSQDKRGAINVIRFALKKELNASKIEEFETCQCYITIYETNGNVLNEDIFVMVSVHKNDGHVNVRFGNKVQIEGMKNAYRHLRVMKGENDGDIQTSD